MHNTEGQGLGISFMNVKSPRLRSCYSHSWGGCHDLVFHPVAMPDIAQLSVMQLLGIMPLPLPQWLACMWILQPL